MYYLGTITGTSGSNSNAWTGPSGIGFFNIPPGVKALYLQASASGVQFEMGIATGISFQTTAGRAAFLNGPFVQNGPFPCGLNNSAPGGAPTILAIFNATGGTVSVRVYARLTQ